MTEKDFPPAPTETLPSVFDQAADINWDGGIYSFGKAEKEQVDWFNPGLVERPDGLWLLVRRADMSPNDGFGINCIVAMKLEDDGKKPTHGNVLRWRDEIMFQQFEDARGCYIPHMNQSAVSACTFQWFGPNRVPAWSGAIQVLGFFDDEWECKTMHYVPFESNSESLKVIPPQQYQKNWVWWSRNGLLHLLYLSEPWTVATFREHWFDGRQIYVTTHLQWPWGMIRGGTPPIEVDGKLITFFHSSTPWFERWRRYHVGIIEFSAEPPFKPIRMTKEPLLSGSTKDPWVFGKPACIFPCGAARIGDKVLVTAGLNDMKACWFSADLDDVMRHLEPLKGKKVPAPQKPTAAKKKPRKKHQSRKITTHKDEARELIG